MINNSVSKNKNAYIILGMQRSGTSATTKVLPIFGINLGDNMLPSNFLNPKGFWEDNSVLSIDEKLLEINKSRWDFIEYGLNPDVNSSIIAPLFSEAVSLVENRLGENNGVWGVKEPRMGNLLGFWKQVFAACNCEMNFIITIRNPISVAESMHAGFGIPHEKSYLLWLRHVVSTIYETRNFNRLIIDYDLLMESPINQIDRIASNFNLTYSKTNDLYTDYLESFLDKEMRSSKYSLSDLDSDSRISKDLISAYSLLLKAAKDEISVNSDELKDAFDQLHNSLKNDLTYHQYIRLIEDTLWNESELLISCQTQLSQLQQTNLSYESRLSEMDQQLEQANLSYESRLSELDQQLQQANSKNLSYESQLSELNQQLQQANSKNLSLESQVTDLDQQLQQANNTVLSFKSSTSWKITKPIRVLKDILNKLLHNG